MTATEDAIRARERAHHQPPPKEPKKRVKEPKPEPLEAPIGEATPEGEEVA